MRFDTPEYLEALEPPSVVLGSRTYVGRLLSIHQWMPLQPRVQAAAQGDVALQEIHNLALAYCRVAFPKPWWKFWRRSVGRQLVKLPPNVLMRALASFFACQGRAMVLPPPQGDVEGEPLTGRLAVT